MRYYFLSAIVLLMVITSMGIFGYLSKAHLDSNVILELTVLGYFTSETVGKTVLHYDPVPGRFEACIPLAEVGNRAWTK